MTARDATEIRLLRPDEFRAAGDVYRGSEHLPDATDDVWAARSWQFQQGRAYGAFRDGDLVGTFASSPSRLRIPGDVVLPLAIGAASGVRAGETRRGVFTGLVRAMLTGLTEPVMLLWPSEAGIYGRFGFGAATRARGVVIDRRRAVVRAGVPGGGSVRLMSLDDAEELLPSLYERLRARPGWVARPDGWWRVVRMWLAGQPGRTTVAVHSGPDGDDGFAVYTVRRAASRSTLAVHDLFTDGPDAFGGLWRFLLSVDLVDEIRAERRPLDEPVEELCVDRGAVTTSGIDDEGWLRLVDVPAALAARTFGELDSRAGTVVMEVRDEFLPANSGCYLLGDGPARRVDDPAALTLDVDVLAQLYLGAVAPSALAGVGRVDVVKADALWAADRLFAVAESPWCGTFG